jgi:hypothetical protein
MGEMAAPMSHNTICASLYADFDAKTGVFLLRKGGKS